MSHILVLLSLTLSKYIYDLLVTENDLMIRIESFYYKFKTQDIYYRFGSIVYYKPPFSKKEKNINQIIYIYTRLSLIKI